MFSRYLPLHSDQSATSGFSLIELLVSIGIIVLVLTIVITQQGAFNSSVLLRSQAYEIALAVREAQLGAVSAQDDGTNAFRSVVGAHFDFDAATNDRYYIFVDANSNSFYDAGEERIGPMMLDPRFEIRDITPSSGSIGAGNDMSVVFERPNFDARFFDAASNELTISNVRIDVGVAGGSGSVCGVDIRTIEITSTGQVAVIECP